MNAELRERLGKAAYVARGKSLDALYPTSPKEHMTWEELREESREFYRAEAEAAVLSFVELFLPVIRNMLSKDEIKRLVQGLE